jgi:hypothetical protein
MLKSLLAFSTVILFALTTMPSQGSKPQQTAPEAAPASAPASAPDHPPYHQKQSCKANR